MWGAFFPYFIRNGWQDFKQRLCWSYHSRRCTGLKLSADNHSTANGWASYIQWFNLHIYNLMCWQHYHFRMPLQQLHPNEIFKETCPLPSLLSEPEESGGSHISGGTRWDLLTLSRFRHVALSCSSQLNPQGQCEPYLSWFKKWSTLLFTCLASRLHVNMNITGSRGCVWWYLVFTPGVGEREPERTNWGERGLGSYRKCFLYLWVLRDT